MKKVPFNSFRLFFVCIALLFQLSCFAQESKADFTQVPGTVITYSAAASKKYIGSPSIAVLPNGNYVASHDFFGPATKESQTAVFKSTDKGKTWTELPMIDQQFWSHLFVHKGVLYIIGPNHGMGNVVIRKSSDGGTTWTNPVDAFNGLLSKEEGYHTAPTPVLVHRGRIWVSMENGIYKAAERKRWTSLVLSAPVNADLLKADQWRWSNRVGHPTVPKLQWIEGNLVVAPGNKLVNILRTNGIGSDTAAIVRISKNGKKVSFDAKNDIIHFPGGSSKFTIRYDSASKRYWSLVNKQTDPRASRNRLVLTSSTDLIHWNANAIILEHPDSKNVAWQYVDWLFEGGDIIAVSRTAYADGMGGANRAHDANFMTFHRISDFRNLQTQTVK